MHDISKTGSSMHVRCLEDMSAQPCVAGIDLASLVPQEIDPAPELQTLGQRKDVDRRRWLEHCRKRLREYRNQGGPGEHERYLEHALRRDPDVQCKAELL